MLLFEDEDDNDLLPRQIKTRLSAKIKRGIRIMHPPGEDSIGRTLVPQRSGVCGAFEPV